MARWWPATEATPRALAAGVLIGGLMCFSNMYFGLQTGWVTMGSLQSTLLGFGLLRLLSGDGMPGQGQDNKGGGRDPLLRSLNAARSSERSKSGALVRVRSWFSGFSAHENVVLQTTAVAAATMPLAGGFVGILPALQCLPPSVGEAVHLNFGEQILWAAALAFFGVFFAVPLRRQTILREKLRFPSGTATAKMLSVLYAMKNEELDPDLHTHTGVLDVPTPEGSENEMGGRGGDAVGHSRSSLDDAVTGDEDGDGLVSPVLNNRPGSSDSSGGDTIEVTGGGTDLLHRHDDNDEDVENAYWGRKWRALFYSFAASAGFAVLSYFVPVLLSVPIFSWVGLDVATEFSWTLTPSLSYVGQGMIMGHRTGWSMLAGAIFGWAFLGPLARGQGWAPGDVNNWETGAKGWILWVSLSIMLAESMASLGVLIAKSGWRLYRARLQGKYKRFEDDFRQPDDAKDESDDSEEGTGKIQERSARRRISGGSMPAAEAAKQDIDPALPQDRVSARWWGSGLGISSLFCVIVLAAMFKMAWYEPIVALLVAILVSVLAVRALGETDLNPVSGVGKVSQLIFAVVAPGAVIPNLVAGAVAEAGAQQAGDLMQDLKTGHLVRASPRAQFIGQMVGSTCSIFFTVVAFALYSSAYELGGAMFPVPTAQVWLDMARLVSGDDKSLPDMVIPFCIGMGILAALLPVLQNIFPNHWLVRYSPSGISFAVAMYVTPNWSLPRVVGATLQFFWLRKSPLSYNRYMIIVASGFVLGEGIMSIVTALMATAGVPRWCVGCLDGMCPGSCGGGGASSWCSAE